MDSLESLTRQITGAKELNSIVRTMKAMAAANIGQYERAMESLGDYWANVSWGLVAYLKYIGLESPIVKQGENPKKGPKSICAIVFGSDQGFVGQFNDALSEYVQESLSAHEGKMEIWTVGVRVPLLLKDRGMTVTKEFNLPNSIHAITALIGSILLQIEENHENGSIDEYYLFHNHLEKEGSYRQEKSRLFPLDVKWQQENGRLKWPSPKQPEVIGDSARLIGSLIREYLFVSLYKTCTESLACENLSRLNAMQRAEKNIEELLDDIGHTYHRLRQSSIDEELFDVVSGFTALKKDRKLGG
ncbi:F0F1 ATP synthase subunit gamma [Zobellia galactanivorans]|uniref:ATP synthase, F1 sector gamma subunit n=1 Tax=Zobellia galactanivorans (strain DSM 12802 / CCUG 47099 / CIP 106680 / NCIMB 13871 / Dsij) TaxID=63186 RepID=G0L880_ZOBGA|nr:MULTISPECIES: F0F1 ATP synthase subunit gamma [Zobellia]MBU3024518.1 F0F1 ATP synthase subunit gamma [Zobellia galactanivorans]MDO6807622.1 F0F1 ATP synthase subunit gamma [Zobellia galactanivorans]OWW25433.1 F0F1 ATP synthase subunit gamma [Zobellia sp. OII3]CAZ98017.1 ATP synthase, F1 sector gamma subunit [Zobellia galactanivorans]